MAHGVHPSVKGVEPARFDPVHDCPGPDAGGEQLRAPDDPVLPAREPGDHLVDGKWDGFCPYSGKNPSRLAHASDYADETATEHPPSKPKFA